MKLLSDYVLVKPIIEEVTKSGIIIPSTVQEKPSRGVVVSVGVGKKDEPMELKKDDVVYFSKYSGTEMTIDDELFILIRQTEIYCVTN